MLTSIIYWLLIWFNSGILSYVALMTVDGVLNRSWPFHWRDSYDYFLSGIGGFISVAGFFITMIQLAIDPSVFEEILDDRKDEKAAKAETRTERVLQIAGLTDDETKRVKELVNKIKAERPEEEEKKDVQ